jgi:hypothetical protein
MVEEPSEKKFEVEGLLAKRSDVDVDDVAK